LQSDPRYSNVYFNMSNSEEYRGPWNRGVSPGLGETWQYVEEPLQHVYDTEGLINQEIMGTDRTDEMVDELNETLSKQRVEEIESAVEKSEGTWSKYTDDVDDEDDED
jgi:Mn-containing catalase